MLLLALCGLAQALDFERLARTLTQRFGAKALPALQEWRRVIERSRGLPEREQLTRVNEFFNRSVLYEEDLQVWNQTDYWATPLETLGRGRGDCEDFAIAKYFTLRELGVPAARLRLVYVKARAGGSRGTTTQPHMVLAYYSAPAADPDILDSLVSEIQPGSRRSDLTPVFSFNAEGLWLGAGPVAPPAAGVARRLSPWETLLKRAREEGFD